MVDFAKLNRERKARTANPPRVKATKAQLVASLAELCGKHRELVQIKRVVEDPQLDTRELKNDDFAKMMQLRRQKR